MESLSEEEANQPQAGKVEQAGSGRREELGLQQDENQLSSSARAGLSVTG